MTKPTVLIVDDILAVRERIQTQISDDFEVVGQAESARQAIELCQQLKPQLVLMGIVMPEMSGIDSMKQILAQIEPAPRVIILSGVTDDTLVMQALAAGAAEYLIKPVGVEKLKAVLRSLAEAV